MATAFACPHCAGTETAVLGHPSVRRRRRCKGCAARFSTVEVFADDLRLTSEFERLRLRMLEATNRFMADINQAANETSQTG
jgi:transcriptional regulator NrdR family protein